MLETLAADSMEGRATATPGSERAARWIAERMEEYGLEEGGGGSYYQRVSREPMDVNVIGIVRGADSALRDEAVIVGAHYDHLGIGAPVNGDSIYNGADDDGSGVVAVLAA
ncbi:MAG: M28 family peptidase, partial [Gemmatimonadales bacterium]|nr:M28 family peptidase [Gemmatimonadales bacterium]